MAQSLETDGKRVLGGLNGDYFVVLGEPLGLVITDGVSALFGFLSLRAGHQ
jgi:hypothetical protein